MCGCVWCVWCCSVCVCVTRGRSSDTGRKRSSYESAITTACSGMLRFSTNALSFVRSVVSIVVLSVRSVCVSYVGQRSAQLHVAAAFRRLDSLLLLVVFAHCACAIRVFNHQRATFDQKRNSLFEILQASSSSGLMGPLTYVSSLAPANEGMTAYSYSLTLPSDSAFVGRAAYPLSTVMLEIGA